MKNMAATLPCKILYVLSTSDKYGGSTKAFMNILDRLSPENITPYVITPQGGGVCDSLVELGVEYKIIPYGLTLLPPTRNLKDYILYAPRLAKKLIMNVTAFASLLKYARKVNPDIIHTNVGPLDLGYRVAKKLNIPHVWHVREYQDLYFGMTYMFSKKEFIRKLNDGNANYPIAITEELSEYFHMGDSARVISDGVLDASATRFTSEKKKYFLFAGRLEEAKGVEELIIAFAAFNSEMPESGYELFIAGDTQDNNYKRKLGYLTERLGLRGKVSFLGMRDDLNDLMFEATALIVPSRHEGFGLVAVEGMFNGCLVVGLNSAGTKKILKDGNGLLYLEHGELVDILKGIAERGVEEFFPMITKAQETAVRLYSQEQNAEKIYELYSDILEKNK